ncbi:putative proton-dependent oligopeptide transporter family, MFS transporter superfamily [Dioscorea sansibarensis]
MAFYAIAVNMVTYLVREMHQSLPHAATRVNDWIGAAFILTILGAFLANAYLGRFLNIVIFTLIYSLVSITYMLHYYYYYWKEKI